MDSFGYLHYSASQQLYRPRCILHGGYDDRILAMETKLVISRGTAVKITSSEKSIAALKTTCLNKNKSYVNNYNHCKHFIFGFVSPLRLNR